MKVALVDGFNMAFRAFYGMPDLTREDGFPTGAIHGWVRTLWWIEDNVEADAIYVFFDLGGASRQLAIREDYKANRGETPEELEKQVPVIKDWTRAAGYAGVEESGIEADDLIAAYSHELSRRGHSVVIISADKDLAQLVTDEVHQLVPPPTANPRIGWRELDPDGVVEKFGVKPSQIADYLALVGDTSDNIPGLKGCGPKTAAKWLVQYGNLEEIINHSGEINPKRFQGMVYAEADELRRNLEMTRLDRTIAVDMDAHAEPDHERACAILEEMEMQKSAETLRNRIDRAGA
ncbi:MAG: 5'-3' exonuclease H3TH domain-containing protein [Puniceicoccaceae bacterium]